MKPTASAPVSGTEFRNRRGKAGKRTFLREGYQPRIPIPTLLDEDQGSENRRGKALVGERARGR